MSAGPPPRSLAELLIWIRRPGEYVICNPHWRSYAVGDVRFLDLLSFLSEARSPDELAKRFGDARFAVRAADRPPFFDGLLGDPTGLNRSGGLEGGVDSLPEIDLEASLELSRRLNLAVDDEAAYAERLGPRRNVFDRGRRGNVHQLVGEHVLLGLRLPSVDEWWVDQKFTKDRREPRAGLYRSVQWPFMDFYFEPSRLQGRRVLDFGCGPGLFSRLFASRGAKVLGLDTNQDHLDTATQLSAEDGLEEADFRLLELPPEDHLARLATAGERFDLIFLSDVLMFYFQPYDPSQELDPAVLLEALSDLLSPNGRIAVLEPNGLFWQQPWLGPETRPFTVLSEYRSRRYGVTPTLEQLSRASERAGLAISKVREVVPPVEQREGREGIFAAEFPLWWYFELRRAEG